MIKKNLSFVLVILLLNLVCHTSVKANSEKEAEFAKKIKTEITKLGTGRDARIKVKLRDKTKIKGYVSEVNDNHFVVVDDKTGISTQIHYPQVKQVKGNNLYTGARIAFTAVLVVGTLIALGLFFAFLAEGMSSH